MANNEIGNLEVMIHTINVEKVKNGYIVDINNQRHGPDTFTVSEGGRMVFESTESFIKFIKTKFKIED